MAYPNADYQSECAGNHRVLGDVYLSPNEGLLVRQRIQVVPGLLALAFFPFITANYLRYREWVKREEIARHQERYRRQYS